MLKIVSINFIIFSFLAILTEITLGNWKTEPTKPSTTRAIGETCYNTLTHHDYCPGIIHINSNHPKDGGQKIENYINKSGIRVLDKKDINSITDFKEYDVINIGDSFLQADEIKYKDTLSFIQEQKTKNKVLQVGYSSWAPITMRRWLESKKLKKHVHVNVFAMINDFTINYGKANIHYQNKINSKGEFNIPHQNTPTKIDKLKQNSFFYSKFKAIFHSQATPPKKSSELSGTYEQKSSNCKILHKLKSKITDLTFNYLEFAFNNECWSEQTVSAVQSAVEDLKKIQILISSIDGTVTFYLIPAGWAFKDENIIGKQTSVYMINQETAITTLELSNYISNYLPIINLENILKKFKKRNKKLLYFPLDGHWNKEAHRVIGHMLSNDKNIF